MTNKSTKSIPGDLPATEKAEDMREQIILNRRNARIRGGYQPAGGGTRPAAPTTGSGVRNPSDNS